jgi:hypothetical protein
MAADYSKACDHDETYSTKNGTYCTHCGAPVPAPINTSELGPIKLDYGRAVEDARRLNWRAVPVAGALPMPVDRAFYAAWQERPWGASDSRWCVERVAPGQSLPPLATHWCDDLLGLPACDD